MEDAIIAVKIIIILLNFLVAFLNYIVYYRSKDERDFWAAFAWGFAGLAWCAGLIDTLYGG